MPNDEKTTPAASSTTPVSQKTAGVCRWGILGAANIAHKNWQAIKNSGNGVVTAVASRDPNRAAELIEQCQAVAPFAQPPRVAADYEAIITATDIDAVYVPLPTCVRGPILKALARGGKHVLTEKPCAASAEELAEVIQACRESKVQFMDGVMFRHSKRMNRIRETITDEAKFGTLTRIASHFTFCCDDDFRHSDIRTKSNLERFGCLGDLGWYNILFTLCMVDFAMPIRVQATMLSDHRDPNCDAAVPMSLSAELIFEGGVSASFYCSFESELQQWASVGSTRGHVWLNDFVIPFAGRKPGFDVYHTTAEGERCVMTMHEGKTRIEVDESTHADVDSQETNLFRNFATHVIDGSVDDAWPSASLKTQQVMDACLKSAKTGAAVAIGF